MKKSLSLGQEITPEEKLMGPVSDYDHDVDVVVCPAGRTGKMSRQE